MLISSWFGVFTPLTCLILHIFCARTSCRGQLGPQKLTLMVTIVSAALHSTLVSFHSGNAVDGAYTGVLSLLYGYIYFHWFNMSETARRIRILVRYVAYGERPDNGNSEYSARTIFHNRIERLTATGTIRESNGSMVLTPGPMLVATRVILFWRRIFYPD